MKCIRIHRAQRHTRAATVARGIGAALLLVGAAQDAASQQPTYPPVQYPGYPGSPHQPQYPQPQYPQVPQPHQPGIPGNPPATGSAFRPPVISLAQPAEGVVVPDDKAVAVFRFAQLEPLDPIDALSFAVSVGGIDRTAQFTPANGEAWGPLAPASEPLAAGQHEVRARICSTRGACGVVKATVTVVGRESLLSAVSPSTSKSNTETQQRRARVLDAVLQAARVLIRP